LEVLLLKAKALDVDEIKDEIKKVPRISTKMLSEKEPEVKKKSPKKEPVKKAPKKEETIKKEPEKQTPKETKGAIDEESLMKQFEVETGKNAIWRGKPTKIYQDWIKEKLG
jgi:ribonucleotide monophosphatase NagD (HAD superfamily)